MIGLDPDILEFVSKELETEKKEVPEQQPGRLDPDISEFVTKELEAEEKKVQKHRQTLRDKYVWGLVAPLLETRLSHARAAMKEIKDPKDRQFVANEVAKVSKAQKWAKEQEYKGAGFGGRYVKNAQRLIGQRLADSLSNTKEAFTLGRDYLQGRSRSKEDIDFISALEAAKQGGDPSVTDANILEKGLGGASQIAPDIAATVGAAALGGTPGVMAYWTGRIAPQERERLIGIGIEPSTAGVAAAVSAAAQGAIEVANIVPFGGVASAPVKKAVRGAFAKFTKKLTNKPLKKIFSSPVMLKNTEIAIETAKRTAIEAGEEYPQATIEAGIEYAVRQMDESVPNISASDIGKRALEATVEAAPGIAFLGGAGGLALARSTVSQNRIKKEVIELSKSGEAPSRSQLKRWGVSPKDGKSSVSERKEITRKLAEGFMEEEQRATAEAATAVEPAVEAVPEVTPEPSVAVPEVATLESTVEDTGAFPGEVEPPTSQAEQVLTEPWADKGEAPVKEVSEVKQFLLGEEGRVKIKAEKFFKYAKSKGARFFLTRGNLPDPVHKANLRRRGQIFKAVKQVEQESAIYERALKTYLDGRLITPKEVRAFKGFMEGEIPLESMPEVLQAPMGTLRNSIDVMSRRLIASGAAEGKLIATIDDHMGMWVNRTFRAFTDPKWADTVSDGVREEAAVIYRQKYPDKTEAEIRGVMDALLLKAKDAASPVALLMRATIGEKDLSILKTRLKMPKEILAFLGEHHDVVLNYANSVIKAATLDANHRFLKEIRKDGLGTYFSEVATGDMIAKIEGPRYGPMAPFAPIYTTKEIKDALARTSLEEVLPWYVKHYMYVAGLSKLSKTVGSTQAQERNFISNANTALWNGNWRVHLAGSAVKITFQDLFNRGSEAVRTYVQRAVELHIIGSSVDVGEMTDNLKESVVGDTTDYIYDKEKRRAHKVRAGLRKVVSVAKAMYTAGDSVWKLYGWENEKAAYRKAYPEWSQEKLEVYTAEIVNNTWPTYIMLPEIIKHLRRLPGIASFPSFRAEIFRTRFKSLVLAAKELKDPRTRTIGATRLAGMVASLSLPAALAAAAAAIVGVSEEDDEDIRLFLADYEKNNQIIYTSKPPDGNIGYVNLSYTDPNAVFHETFKAFLRGESLGDKLTDAFMESMQPFYSKDILTKAVLEAYAGETDYGGKIRSEQDPAMKQIWDVAWHLWNKALEPGIITTLRKIGEGVSGKTLSTGKVRDPVVETISGLTGTRFQILDFRQSLGWLSGDFDRDISEAENIFRRIINNRGTVSEGDMESAYARAESARKFLFKKISREVQGARNLGASRGEVKRILKEHGVTFAYIDDILAGTYTPFTLTKGRRKTLRGRNPEAYVERKGIARRLRKEASGGP